MYFRVGASQVFRVNAAAILPQNHEGLLVGSDSVRFSRVNAQSYAGNFQDSPTGPGAQLVRNHGQRGVYALPAASGRTGVTYLVEHSGQGRTSPSGEPAETRSTGRCELLARGRPACRVRVGWRLGLAGLHHWTCEHWAWRHRPRGADRTRRRRPPAVPARRWYARRRRSADDGPRLGRRLHQSRRGFVSVPRRGGPSDRQAGDRVVCVGLVRRIALAQRVAGDECRGHSGHRPCCGGLGRARRSHLPHRRRVGRPRHGHRRGREPLAYLGCLGPSQRARPGRHVRRRDALLGHRHGIVARRSATASR
jgi:hypothetical protein